MAKRGAAGRRESPERKEGLTAAEQRVESEDAASPVLTVLAKRLRASKKKLKKIEEIEAKAKAGEEINADQVTNTPCCVLLKGSRVC
jgi:hypothetical protein